MKTEHKLYNDKVTVTFDPDARTNRYIVTDETAKLDKQPVPGVTSVLDKALSKPGLMTFPLNAALSHLGAVFSEEQGKWVLKQEITLTSELVGSAAKAWTVRSDAGKDVGTEVHTAIEQFLNKQLPVLDTMSQEATKAYLAFCKWYETQDIKPLAVEQIVYSRAHQFAGTFDCLLEIDGKTVLCDLKTTNISRYGILVNGKWTGIYPENFLQLGAYSLAWLEETREPYNGTYEKDEFIGTYSNERKIDDLMVINVTKTGDLHTLRASELGLSVGDCEQQFLNARELVNFLGRIKKGQK